VNLEKGKNLVLTLQKMAKAQSFGSWRYDITLLVHSRYLSRFSESKQIFTIMFLQRTFRVLFEKMYSSFKNEYLKNLPHEFVLLPKAIKQIKKR
jgi:membrane protein required for beta-lactamase induction